MSFKDAVLATEGLADAYQSGLQAVRRRDQRRITCSDPNRLTGSVNLDDALAASHPQDLRWDYGIGIGQGRGGELVVWLEVHPASSGDVAAVIAKFDWLKAWLAASAPQLRAIDPTYVWVASGSVSLPKNSPKRRKLAALGIQFAGAHCRI